MYADLTVCSCGCWHSSVAADYSYISYSGSVCIAECYKQRDELRWSRFHGARIKRAPASSCPHPDPFSPPRQTAYLLEAHSSNDNFCEFAFPGQCSVLGVYQPELPKGDQYGRFYGFAG